MKSCESEAEKRETLDGCRREIRRLANAFLKKFVRMSEDDIAKSVVLYPSDLEKTNDAILLPLYWCFFSNSDSQTSPSCHLMSPIIELDIYSNSICNMANRTITARVAVWFDLLRQCQA